MSALSDEYIKNFSKERKSIFNKRFRDDYDPNMSERSNIIRILNEMRELNLADGGRIGLKEGLGSFETNDPGEAIREIIERMVDVKGATFPISENISLKLGPDLNQAELGGIIKILGGQLNLGVGKKGVEKGVGLIFEKKFNKGGRVAYQEGTPDRKLYETPVTDAIKSVNEKTIEALEKGGELFNKYSGIDAVYDFPGAGSGATGASSDFRHQAASNALAKALGKGQYTDPILGPISYLSGAIGSLGLGTGKEVIDFFKGVADPNMTTKEAFDQAIEDTISNAKGAFASADTTSEDLYAELMKDYQPIRTGMFDPFKADETALIFMERKKALEDAKKKQKDFIEQEVKKIPPKKPKITTTTKPGTGGGGGDGTFGVGSDGQKSYDFGTGFGTSATTGGPVSNKTGRGRTDYSLGGLARMLGE
jgi:hypothetical protein